MSLKQSSIKNLDPQAPASPGSEKDLDPDNAPPIKSDRPQMSLTREVFFVITIVAAQLLTQAGMGQGLAPLHIIGDHFHIQNPGQLSWYVASFSLTVGTFILIAGRLGDMYGHKRMFIAAFTWYGVWSILCGASYYSTNIFFTVARGFQGMGPAFLTPNGLALLATTYPNGMRKNMIFSLFGACAPGGYMLGAAFSSLLAEKATWAWAYFIMGIVCFIMAGATIWTVPNNRNMAHGANDDENPTEKEERLEVKEQRFDHLGAVTGVSGLVLINVAWNQGPTVGWPDPYVYILLILGILSLILFVIIESRVPQPLLPVSALTVPVLFVLSALSAGWASFGIWLYYIWQFLQQLRHHSALVVSAETSPSAIAGFIASIITGILISKVPIPYIMVFALVAFCITPILSATMPIGQTYWSQTFISTLIIPFGMDMSFPSAIILLSGSVPKEHQGIAASLVLTVTNYSISLGLGIAGTVARQIDPQGTNLLRQFRSGWYTGIGLSGMGILIAIASALYMRRHPLAAHPH